MHRYKSICIYVCVCRHIYIYMFVCMHMLASMVKIVRRWPEIHFILTCGAHALRYSSDAASSNSFGPSVCENVCTASPHKHPKQEASIPTGGDRKSRMTKFLQSTSGGAWRGARSDRSDVCSVPQMSRQAQHPHAA